MNNRSILKIIFLSIVALGATSYPSTAVARGGVEHHPQAHRQVGGERSMEHRNMEVNHPAARGFERGVEAGAAGSGGGATVVNPVYVDPNALPPSPTPSQPGS